MTMKKRITSFALVLLMVLSSLAVLLPVTGVKAAADESTTTTPEKKIYKKVTAEPEDGDWSGTYLIVYEEGSVAFDGSGSTKDALDVDNNTISVTIGDDKTITLEEGHTFTIAKASNNDFTLKSAGGIYIGRTASTNGFETSSDENDSYTHSLTYVKDKQTVTIKSSGGPALQCWVQKTTCRFKYYKSAQKAVSLYKLTSDDNPDNPDHTHTPKVDENNKTIYKWDADKHYTICADKNCPNTDGKYDAEAHTFTAWESAGETTHTHSCEVCGATYSEEHKWVNAGISGDKVVQNCECGATREIPVPGDATVVFGKLGLDKDTDLTDLTLLNGVTIKFAEGKNKNNSPKYYTSDSTARLYVNNTMTITAPAGRVISKIEITFRTKNYAKVSTGDSNYSLSNTVGTWSGCAKDVVFTGTDSSRILSIYVITADDPINSATLNIGTNIDVNYYVVLPEGISYEKYVMRFTFNGKTIDVESTTGDKFTFENVGPHQMGLNIAAVLYGVNGETYTKLAEKLEYSVKENLESLLNNENETVKTLAKNMLIYGAAAQKYTGAADADLVTSETHTATPSLPEKAAASVDNKNEFVNFVGMKLIFDNEPRLAIKYVLLNDATANDVTFEDLNGKLTHDGEYVYLNGVTADKFAEENMVGNSLDHSTVTFTVNTYIYYILNSTTTSDNMKALATALYYYGVAAEAYVNAQTTQQ